MDINTQNSSGMMNGMPPVTESNKKIGPIIGTLVIVIVIIIGALYFFGKRLDSQLPSTNDTTIPVRNDSASVIPEATNEAVVNEATLDSELDSQLKDIDSSF